MFKLCLLHSLTITLTPMHLPHLRRLALKSQDPGRVKTQAVALIRRNSGRPHSFDSAVAKLSRYSDCSPELDSICVACTKMKVEVIKRE
jgi:hypothetical protein